MSAPLPAYTVEQLAAGSYDVLRGGYLIASLVRSVSGKGTDVGWRIDLLDETPSPERPPPFMEQSHTFPSRAVALAWLGIHERGIVDAQAG